MTAKKTKPMTPELQADIDYLATLLAKGVSGMIELGFSDGVKMKGAMDRIRKSDVGLQLAAKMWAQFWVVNPQASAAIEMAATLSPGLKSFLEGLQMKAKDVKPEDVNVKDAEKA